MKILYIESRLMDLDLKLQKEEINKLPRRLFLAYTIQYKELAEKIKKQLEDNKIKITKFRQVLGCSIINIKEPVLLIGTGNFHALNLFLQSPIIYIIGRDKVKQVPKEEIESFRNKRKSVLLRYLNAEKIGILVSTKPGQENLKEAVKLKNSILKKGKKAYIFLSNNIDISQFENFNIDSWINTACIGLSYDSPDIINYSEIKYHGK